MHRFLFSVAVVAGLISFTPPAQAQTTRFAEKPQTKSADGANFVSDFGASIYTSIDFN